MPADPYVCSDHDERVYQWALARAGEGREAARAHGHQTPRELVRAGAPPVLPPEPAWQGSVTHGCYLGLVRGSRGPLRQRPSSPFTSVARARKARPRAEIACFSAGPISPNVRPSPSSGTNTGS